MRRWIGKLSRARRMLAGAAPSPLLARTRLRFRRPSSRRPGRSPGCAAHARPGAPRRRPTPRPSSRRSSSRSSRRSRSTPMRWSAQVMMAATYPLEVIQAARFVKANPKLKDTALNDELKKYDWDDSVKSLASFPQTLELMNEKIDWTQKLGDAFLGQRKDTMDAIQRLRAKAQAQGNLEVERAAEGDRRAAEAQPASSRPQHAADHRQDRAGESAGRLRAELQPDRRIRGHGRPRYPPYYPVPARIRLGRGGALLRRRHGGRRRGLGRLQLGRRRRRHRREQEQQLHQQREPQGQGHPDQRTSAARPARVASRIMQTQSRAPQGRPVPRQGHSAEVQPRQQPSGRHTRRRLPRSRRCRWRPGERGPQASTREHRGHSRGWGRATRRSRRQARARAAGPGWRAARRSPGGHARVARCRAAAVSARRRRQAHSQGMGAGRQRRQQPARSVERGIVARERLQRRGSAAVRGGRSSGSRGRRLARRRGRRRLERWRMAAGRRGGGGGRR